MSDAMPPTEAGERAKQFAPQQWWSGPYLKELVTVIPIAQSATSEDTTITLFSLEAFADGVRLQGRLVKDAPHPEAGSPTIPRMVFRLQDDCGNVADLRESNGGGNMARWEFSAVAARPLDPKAKRLIILLEEVVWQDFAKPAPENVVERLRVDWTFEVAIPPRSE